MKLPYGYWNSRENCIKAAQTVASRREFARKYPGAYYKCLVNHWDEAFEHMKEKANYIYNYTYDYCAMVALRCNSQAQMRREYPSVHHYAARKKILKEIFKHTQKAPITYEQAKKAALLCHFKQEFSFRFPREYRYARYHKFLDEICAHMVKMHDLTKRGIYAFEFEDKCVYVGLTCSFERRKYEHLTHDDSAVYKHIEKTSLQPAMVIKSDYIDFFKAKELEGIILRDYTDKGWNALNRTGTGSLGTNSRMGVLLVKCTSRAKYCIDFKEMSLRFPNAYSICEKYDWFEYLDDYLGSIEFGQFALSKIASKKMSKKKLSASFPERMKGKHIAFRYTDEELEIEIRRYKNKTKLKSKNNSAFHQAKNRGLLEVVFPNNANEVSNEQLKQEAQMYSSRKELEDNNNAHYQLAMKRHILDEICAHMPFNGYKDERTMLAHMDNRTKAQKKGKYWTAERILKRIKEGHFESITDFINRESGAYDAARNIGIMNKVRELLPSKISYWTNEDLHKEALMYDRRSDFRKGSPKAYNVAFNRGILDIICSHMHGKRSWKNIEDVRKEALKYDLISDFISKSSGAYMAARKLGIVDDVCKHMRNRK